MSTAQIIPISQLSAGDVALLGIGSDFNSSYLRGPAKAPQAIREVLYSGSSNMCSESGVDLNANTQFKDAGDHAVKDTPDDFLNITGLVESVLEKQSKPLILGGDHAITFPVVRALAAVHGEFDILHFDAHADIYHEFEGNPFSHACPFARIMENQLCNRLTQVGIRTLNQHQREQIERFKVTVIEMKDFHSAHLSMKFENPLYISFDMDALDPAYAPGVSHHEPGGLSVRQVLEVVQTLKVPVIGADIVEYNPDRDHQQMTAAVAAKLVKEFAGLMLG